jgi:hypothetical protein
MATMMTAVCSLGAKSRQTKNKNVLSLDTILPSPKPGIIRPLEMVALNTPLTLLNRLFSTPG